MQRSITGLSEKQERLLPNAERCGPLDHPPSPVDEPTGLLQRQLTRQEAPRQDLLDVYGDVGVSPPPLVRNRRDRAHPADNDGVGDGHELGRLHDDEGRRPGTPWNRNDEGKNPAQEGDYPRCVAVHKFLLRHRGGPGAVLSLPPTTGDPAAARVETRFTQEAYDMLPPPGSSCGGAPVRPAIFSWMRPCADSVPRGGSRTESSDTVSPVGFLR